VRNLASAILLLALGAIASGPAAGQLVQTPPQAEPSGTSPRTTLLVGGGVMEHQHALVPAKHVAVRRLLVARDSVSLWDLDGRAYRAERLELHLEGQLQRSSGATRCEVFAGEGCFRTEHLLSTGISARMWISPDRLPLQLQFVPASASVHLSQRRLLNRGEPTPTAPFGVYTPGDRVTAVGFGIGNGVALRARVADRDALLEMRPTLIRYPDGRRGGMIPISMGIAF
jgi:hypothetical protein